MPQDVRTAVAQTSRRSHSRQAVLSDFDILNFALNLEYLEAEFFSIATTGQRLPDSLTTGVGTAGPTTGGQRVAFEDPILAATAAELAADELAHVRFLRSVLGAQAIAKPAINLNALGLGFANGNEFLTLQRSIEDVGTSAYAGAARLLTNKDILEAAARILADEAYHVGNTRYQLVARGVNVPPVDAKDQPPSPSNFFPADGNALAIIRTPSEVLAIVYANRAPGAAGGGFFPSGVNGAIRTV
jgi:hypothetical protein